MISRLPATVWLLGLVSFFNDSASELVYPLLPLYLASVLMAGPGALGIIEGVAEATASLLKLFSGVWSDRMASTKGWVVGGYFAAAAARPLLALASSWPQVLALRFVDRVGKGLRTSPRDAMLALVVSPESRGLAFGIHRSFDNAGAVLGPLFAAWALYRQMPIRELLLIAGAIGLLAVLFSLSLKEPARAAAPSTAFDWRLAALPRPFKRYLLALAIFTLGNSSNMFLLLRARDLGLPDYQVPLLWAAVSFSAMVFSTPFSALSDRIGRRRLIIAGWGVYALFYLLLGFDSTDSWLIWPLFAGYGLFMAATEGAERALVADFAAASQYGTAYGWFNLVAGIMLLPASVLFGWVWQQFGPRQAFFISASLALAAALLLRFWVISPSNASSRGESDS